MPCRPHLPATGEANEVSASRIRRNQEKHRTPRRLLRNRQWHRWLLRGSEVGNRCGAFHRARSTGTTMLARFQEPVDLRASRQESGGLLNCSLTISATRSLYKPTHCSILDESKTRPTSKSKSQEAKPPRTRAACRSSVSHSPSACDSLIYCCNKARTLSSG